MASARKVIRKPSSTPRQARGLSADLAAFFRDLAKAIVDPYRPERHYMRGPGPKWHAKHNPAPAAIPAHVVPALVRIKAH